MPTCIAANPVEQRSSSFVRSIRLIIFCLLGSLLAACANQQRMYSWDSYQPAVYAYLQGDEDPAGQIQAMEKNIEVARTQHTALPPGFHAHLGLLYLKQGQDSQAMEQIQDEKASFPESTSFMNFLLRQAKYKNVSVTTSSDKQVAPSALKPAPIEPDHNNAKQPL